MIWDRQGAPIEVANPGVTPPGRDAGGAPGWIGMRAVLRDGLRTLGAIGACARWAPRTCGNRLTSCFFGVSDGIRTRDIQDHNLALCQLSYAHRDR
jgi:hypothetical protein